MRVLHVATAFPRDESDPITPWMVELIRTLRDRGTDARVLAPAYRGSGDHVVHGIPVYRFRYGPAAWETLTHDETVPDRIRRSAGYASLVPLYLAGGLVSSLRQGLAGSWDVVHVHWPMPHGLFGAALRLASGGRTAVVSSYYSVELTWVRRRMPWLEPSLRWTTRSADVLTANSSATAEKVQRYTSREVRVVPSPAPFDESVGPDGETRTPLGGDGPLRLLFVGRLVERKGVEYLVRALPRILEERPAVLTVVGEGERRPQIEAAAREAGVQDRVEFTGYIPAERLESLYRTCDVFVLPAVVDEKGDTEGLGVVLLEALLFERPVVASGVGGIVDIVRDGETGWRVPPRDPGSIAEAVLEASSDPGRARETAARGRRHVLDSFSSDAIAQSLEGIYRRAASARRDEHERGDESG